MFKKPILWIVFVLFSIGCAIFAFNYFSSAYPIVTIDLKMDREAALESARDLAQKNNWGPQGFDQAASFKVNSRVQNFVELEAGGTEALKKMITNLKEARLAAHIVDGPKWPSGKVKPGAIRLAHATDSVIVPVYAFAENGWYFNSWDKFLLPKPFSKVLIRFGKMTIFSGVQKLFFIWKVTASRRFSC